MYMNLVHFISSSFLSASCTILHPACVFTVTFHTTPLPLHNTNLPHCTPFCTNTNLLHYIWLRIHTRIFYLCVYTCACCNHIHMSLIASQLSLLTVYVSFHHKHRRYIALSQISHFIPCLNLVAYTRFCSSLSPYIHTYVNAVSLPHCLHMCILYQEKHWWWSLEDKELQCFELHDLKH